MMWLKRFIIGCLYFLFLTSTTILLPDLSWGLGDPDKEVYSQEQAGQVGKKIKNLFEDNLYRLEPKTQGHYSIRLWRVTGNSRYLYPILFHYLVMKEQFIQHAGNLHSPEYINSFSDKFLSEKFKTPKGQIRKKLLEKHKEFVFACELLEMAYQIKSLGMDTAELQNVFGQAQDYLASLRFNEFLLDTQIVKYYAPQAVNYVYYLKFLGLSDLEQEFKALFRQVFSSEKDSDLDEIEYENKIYGLTHFIIAGSNYYQVYVSSEKYLWILNYFEEHIEEILQRSKPDVIGEVGLCFKLCGQKKHRVVSLTAQKIIEAFDSKQGLIPPEKGKANLNKSEHRNIIAYLLLTDFEQFYPGPNLVEIAKLNYIFEYIQKGE